MVVPLKNKNRHGCRPAFSIHFRSQKRRSELIKLKWCNTPEIYKCIKLLRSTYPIYCIHNRSLIRFILDQMHVYFKLC